MSYRRPQYFRASSAAISGLVHTLAKVSDIKFLNTERALARPSDHNKSNKDQLGADRLMNSFITLRTVANRLNTTPIGDLPQQVGYLATSIFSCKDVFQGTGSGSNENALLLHKLKTRVSALLQDRSPQGRLSGIVIVKALVEAGGLPFLSESGSWVRNLISCLNKSDSWEVKRLCLTTISRIYLLTVEHQALVREITTPTLPAFITTSLGLIKPATSTVNGKTIRALSPLLEVVLSNWHMLIEYFASTFRPHVSSLRSICLSLLSDNICPDSTRLAATSLLARLHFCAPKNTAATEWSQTCAQTIEAAHDTADLVFRAIVEDWTPAVPRVSKATRKQKSANTPATSNPDVLGLDAWSGVSEGISRLAVQVDLLEELLTSQHIQAVSIPLGHIFDLTSRLSAVTPPTSKFSLRTNNEITRDEREELWLHLPRIHITVLNLLKALTNTYAQALFPVANALTTQLWDIFDVEHSNESIRTATYALLTTLLPHQLLCITKSDSRSMSLLINHICSDLKFQSGLSSTSTTNPSSNTTNGTKFSTLTLPTSTANNPVSHCTPSNLALHKAAHTLLPIIITHLPLHVLSSSSSLRSDLDSTAILTQHHEAILASTLHPPRPRGKASGTAPAPSLLPFLARSKPQDSTMTLAKEALIHPRMPFIRSTLHSKTDEADTDDEEDEDVTDARVTSKNHSPYPDNHLDIYPEDTQEALNNMATERLRQIQDEHNIQAATSAQGEAGVKASISAQQDLQAFSSAQKRDFTTLLEQSADAQLAADGIAPEEIDVTSTIKKARIEPEVADTTIVDVKSADDLAIAPAAQPDEDSAMTVPVVAVDETKLHDLPSATADMREGKGKEKAIDNDDTDSSDSDVPPIDATLVGMSDSEEEEY